MQNVHNVEFDTGAETKIRENLQEKYSTTNSRVIEVEDLHSSTIENGSNRKHAQTRKHGIIEAIRSFILSSNGGCSHICSLHVRIRMPPNQRIRDSARAAIRRAHSSKIPTPRDDEQLELDDQLKDGEPQVSMVENILLFRMRQTLNHGSRWRRSSLDAPTH